MKKITAFLLAALLCFAALILASCNDDETASDASDNAESSEAPQEKGFLNEIKDWGGKDVVVLTHDQRDFSTIIIPESSNGEPINDAFLARNNYIEQNFGISLKLETCSDPGEGASRVRNDYESGLNEIDVVSLPLAYIATLGVEGILYDFNSINNGYIHLDKEWWDQAAIRDLTINNKLWFLAGDALIEDDESTWAIYFNKDLVNSYKLDDPYELVRDDKWTLDTMYEMIKKVHHQTGSAMTFTP